MATIVTRAGKGSPLTNTELDANFTGLNTDLSGKQATLVSGTSIKTINGQSLLGSGDLTISGGSGGATLADVIALSIALG
jgi:hypothetical protein